MVVQDKIIIGSKYWKIWKMIILTVILLKNEKKLKIIKETKQRLIEKDESTETLKNRWYDQECKIAVEEMKKAGERWLIKGIRENEE
jgi:phosphopantetheine adenylyltransferase